MPTTISDIQDNLKAMAEVNGECEEVIAVISFAMLPLHAR